MNQSNRNYYEKDNDKVKEHGALGRLSAAWGKRIDPTSIGAPFDAFVYNNDRLESILEYKNRDIKNFSRIPHIILSARKYIRIRSAALKTKIRFLFVIEIASGALFCADLTNTDLSIHKGSGRTKKTRDAWDIEECVHIPRSYFEKVVEK